MSSPQRGRVPSSPPTAPPPPVPLRFVPDTDVGEDADMFFPRLPREGAPVLVHRRFRFLPLDIIERAAVRQSADHQYVYVDVVTSTSSPWTVAHLPGRMRDHARALAAAIAIASIAARQGSGPGSVAALQQVLEAIASALGQEAPDA